VQHTFIADLEELNSQLVEWESTAIELRKNEYERPGARLKWRRSTYPRSNGDDHRFRVVYESQSGINESRKDALEGGLTSRSTISQYNHIHRLDVLPDWYLLAIGFQLLNMLQLIHVRFENTSQRCTGPAI
jgi:hypothetical protein